jgi:hypothetical protein
MHIKGLTNVPRRVSVSPVLARFFLRRKAVFACFFFDSALYCAATRRAESVFLQRV